MAESDAQPVLLLLDAAPQPRRLAVFTALNLASAAGLVWLLAQAALQFRLSPIAVLVEALGCAFLACLWSIGVSAAFYVAVPLFEREDFFRNARRTAATAVWLAPAAILLGSSSPGAPIATLVAVVLAARLLRSQWDELAGQSEAEDSSLRPAGMFDAAIAGANPLRRGFGLSLAAAAAIQAGIGAILLDHPQAGLAFAAMSAALLTALAPRSRRPVRQNGSGEPALRIAGRLFLTTCVTMAGLALRFDYRPGNGFGAAASGGAKGRIVDRVWPGGEKRTNPGGVGKRLDEAALGLGGDYPGVILWPEVQSVTLLVSPVPYGMGRPGAARNPFHIPFGGEYWMYRPPGTRPPAGSYFRRGSPAVQTFHTVDRWPLAMEARQKLEQSIDARCCTEIQVVILNAEPNSGGVSLELLLIGRVGKVSTGQSVGWGQVLSKPGPGGSPVEESIAFPLPTALQFERFDELRVLFHRGPDLLDRSVRIAIERFVLIPR